MPLMLYINFSLDSSHIDMNRKLHAENIHFSPIFEKILT